MWLLSTSTAELRHFPGPAAVPGGYAILSHKWSDNEQNFREIKTLGKRCKATRTNPRDFVSLKIRGFCVLAEHHGYAWGWVDSCCIDKTDSSELSEAINSMFQWYSQAEVCYVYLADVQVTYPHDAFIPRDAFVLRSCPFGDSVWHTRGWTLQELIAPATVMFFSFDWIYLGNKESPQVSRLLEDITGIPRRLLMRHTRFHEYSVAQRLSWAARRNTTRVEDEAYCLFGLFDVHMTTIYGEGRRAFQRLQLEIMKTSDDTSIFAWDDCLAGGDLDSECQDLRLCPGEMDVSDLDERGYLLARSPRSFSRSVGYCPSSAISTVPSDSIERPRFAITKYGIECQLPFIEAGDGYRVAILFCRTDRGHLGLVLRKDISHEDSTRSRYRTGAPFQCIDPSESGSMAVKIRRVVYLGDDLENLRFDGKATMVSWDTVYVIPSNDVDWASPNASFSRLRLGRGARASFRIPHWLIATFSAIGFEVEQKYGDDNLEPAYRLLFGNPAKGERIFVDLGLCEQESASAAASDSALLSGQSSVEQARLTPWARVFPNGSHDGDPWLEPPTHDCLTDHVTTWSDWSNFFHNGNRTVGISLRPCKMTPRTFIVHLELLGSVYDDILCNANVKFPKRDELPQPNQVPVELHVLTDDGVSMPPASSFMTPIPQSRWKQFLVVLILLPLLFQQLTTKRLQFLFLLFIIWRITSKSFLGGAWRMR